MRKPQYQRFLKAQRKHLIRKLRAKHGRPFAVVPNARLTMLTERNADAQQRRHDPYWDHVHTKPGANSGSKTT